MAASCGQPALAEFLRERGSQEPAATLTIHEAVEKGELGEVTALLEKNAALISSKDAKGRTPLHLAAANAHRAMAELLMRWKADVNARDNDGQTPLHAVAACPSTDSWHIASLMLHWYQADVNARDNDGRTPLHQTVMRGVGTLADLLLSDHADVNAKDNSGMTPLGWAIALGPKYVEEKLRNRGAQE